MNNPPEFPTYFTDNHAMSMTLRDYFAAKAMQAFYTNYENSSDAREASIRAYEIADAMLKAREA